jgi:hypothetical protein
MISMTDRSGWSTETRLAFVEDKMDQLMGNGKPGIIHELREDIGEVKDVVLKGRYILLGFFLSVMVMLFLSGSGTVSLKTILSLLH